jgi:hypothetical protein
MGGRVSPDAAERMIAKGIGGIICKDCRRRIEKKT